MQATEEIQLLFSQLSGSSQSDLLNTLLQEHELRGKILEDASEEVSLQRKTKPCPHCRSTKVYKRGKKEVFKCIAVMNVKKHLKAVESKRLSKEDIKKVFEGKLSENATLITDKHPSYRAFAKDNPSIKHKALLAKEHVDKKDK